MNVQELLERKSTELISIKASVSVLEAIATMCDKKVGALLIESDDGQLIGIATERDILRLCSSRHGRIDDAMINEAMTRDLIVGSPDCTVDQAMSMMTEHRFRHLPIIDGGKSIGMISIGDLVKAKLKDVTVEVKYLRDYISA